MLWIILSFYNVLWQELGSIYGLSSGNAIETFIMKVWKAPMEIYGHSFLVLNSYVNQ